MKQLQKQMEENHTNHTTIANHSAFHNNQRHSSSDNSPPMQRQSRNGSHYSADADSIMYEEISHSYHPNIATYLDPTYKRNSTAVLPPNPLLNPSPKPVESSVDDVEEPGIHFAQVYKVTPTPSPSDSPYNSSTRPANRPMLRDPEPEPYEDNYYPIEESSRRTRVSPTSQPSPYLPVQGQRRLSSIDKKKKYRDNCKTQ